MKSFYVWYATLIIVFATIVNYTAISDNRSYSSSGGSSIYRSSGGWHK